jgi:hypothetical protein
MADVDNYTCEKIKVGDIESISTIVNCFNCQYLRKIRNEYNIIASIRGKKSIYTYYCMYLQPQNPIGFRKLKSVTEKAPTWCQRRKDFEHGSKYVIID